MERASDFCKDPPERFDLVQMQVGEFQQTTLACRSQVDFDLTTILFSRLAYDKTRALASRNQRGRAVGRGLQALREFADARPRAPRDALNMQQQQILQRVIPAD